MMRQVIILIFLMILTVGVIGAIPEATQLNYTPSPALPGATIEILIQLENNQDRIEENVIVTIDGEYPFTLVGDLEKNIGDMEKYGKALAKFTVYIDPSAENQTYNLTTKVKSENNTSSKGKTFPIIISGKAPIIKVVGLGEDTLHPGQKQEISFLLKNVGTSAAYDVILELQEDRTVTATGTIVEREITPLGAATAYVTTIGAGEEEYGKIMVSVNRTAELKNYTLPVKVSYRTSSGTRSTETSYVGFRVAGDVDLDSTMKDIPSAIVAGVKTQINLELFNKGIGKAEYTLVEVSTDNGVVEKPRQFIGSLEPNDVDSFKAQITFNSNLETSEQIIKLTVTYQDTDASTKTKEIALPVMIYSQVDGAAVVGADPIAGIINIILIIILIVIVWKGYKKFKK
jgi:hypothetical protein